MREDLTEIVFILDKSGSMCGLEADTIGGFNAMIEKQKNGEGQALVSTVLFSDQCRVIHDRVPIDKVRKLTSRQYSVGGSTALLDAVGEAIHHVGNIHKYARKEDVPGKTLFVITTDGMENSSYKYSYKDIKRMIKRQKERYHWEFLFLGANIDAAEMADSIGIDRNCAANYNCDSEGTALNYKVLEEAVSRVRACAPGQMCEELADGDWKAKIDADYKKRRKQI